LFTYVRRTDHNLLLFNNLLLLGVTFVPFPTAVIAKYLLNGPADTAKVAAMFYSGVDIFLAIAFNLLWRHIAYWGRLMAKNTPPEFIESITRSYRFGPWVYAVSFTVAFVSGQASFAITLLLAVFFALPRTLGAQNKGPS